MRLGKRLMAIWLRVVYGRVRSSQIEFTLAAAVVRGTGICYARCPPLLLVLSSAAPNPLTTHYPLPTAFCTPLLLPAAVRPRRLQVDQSNSAPHPSQGYFATTAAGRC